MKNETKIRRKLIELGEQAQTDKKFALAEKGITITLAKKNKALIYGPLQIELLGNKLIISKVGEGVVTRITLVKPKDNINKALQELNITLL